VAPGFHGFPHRTSSGAQGVRHAESAKPDVRRLYAHAGRWPLAAGRWPLAAGRWPLAALIALAAGALAMSTEVRASPPEYEMFEIDIIRFAPDADTLGRFGINNRGEIAYTRRVGQQYRAMVYLHCDAYGLSSGVHDLADLFRDQSDQLILTGDSYARDIGDQGVVVGQFDGVLRGEGRAFAIDLAGTLGLNDHVAVWPPSSGGSPPTGCSDWGRAVAVTSESMGLPQSVSDCINRVGLDPVALSACVSAIE